MNFRSGLLYILKKTLIIGFVLLAVSTLLFQLFEGLGISFMYESSGNVELAIEAGFLGILYILVPIFSIGAFIYFAIKTLILAWSVEARKEININIGGMIFCILLYAFNLYVMPVFL